jgi:tetratricopeptide (TPR) repeat protein
MSQSKTWIRVAGLLVWALLAATVVRAQGLSAALAVAKQQFQEGKFGAAIHTLTSTGEPGKDAESNFWLERCYYELRDYDKAVAAGEEAIQLAPQNSEYHLWLGRSYGEKADRDHSFTLARRVKKEFEEAVRLDPNNIHARRDLAEFEVDAPWIVGGSKEAALEQVNAIAATDPVEGHLARAVVYLAEKKNDLAEAEYKQVLASRPAQIDAYAEVADFYVRNGRAADLRATVDAAAKVKASDPRLAYYRGVAVVLSGSNLAEGEQDLKSYLANPSWSNWPSQAAAREWLGRLYEAEGKKADAAEQYRAALRLDPARKSVQDRLKKLDDAPR